MKIQSKLVGAAIMGIAVVAGISVAHFTRRHAPVELAAGTYLDPTRPLPDFSLIDDHGRAFGPANLRGSWSMVYFGYTNCPDACPTTLTALAALEKRMRAARAPVRPKVIFISVDAKRDTPEQLAKYVPYFDPEFVGLTAPDQPAIQAVAAKFGVLIVIAPHAEGAYTVDHSSAIFVINPKGEVAAILTGPFTLNALQGDFQHIVAAQT